MFKFFKMNIFILSTVLAVAVYLLFFSPGLLKETFFEELAQKITGEKTEEKPSTELAEELRDLFFLEELLEKSFPENEEDLLAFSEREDAIGYKAGLELARSYAREGQDARDLFHSALALRQTASVEKELAFHLMEMNYEEEAKEYFFRLFPDNEAKKALLELEVAPLEIAHYLYDESHYRELTSFLQPYWEDYRAAELKHLFAAGLVNTGDYREALPLLEDLTQEEYLLPEIDGGADVGSLGWYYARCLEAMGETEKALSLYEEAGLEGNYRRGIIFNAMDEKTEAAEAFSVSLEQAGRWWGARLWEELGETEKALSLYMQLARGVGYVQDDAAYRSYLILSREEDPRAEEFLEYLSSEPAWLERLGKEPKWETEESLPQVTPSFINRAEAYRESGRDEVASLELTIGENIASPEELLSLGEWYFQREDYFKTVRLGIELVEMHPCPKSYQIAFPRPYKEEVEEAAGEYQLDPHLIWAVMREESHFRPAVISSADARGLMQVMPATGQDIARRMDMEISTGDLFDPELNIRFGAWYLRAMLDSFNEDYDKALAAYNAGSSNVRRWSGSPLGQEPGGFPTAITYRETRQYTTRVMNSYLTYNWLYE